MGGRKLMMDFYQKGLNFHCLMIILLHADTLKVVHRDVFVTKEKCNVQSFASAVVIIVVTTTEYINKTF